MTLTRSAINVEQAREYLDKVLGHQSTVKAQAADLRARHAEATRLALQSDLPDIRANMEKMMVEIVTTYASSKCLLMELNRRVRDARYVLDQAVARRDVLRASIHALNNPVRVY